MTKTTRLIRLMMAVYEKKRFTVDELANEFGVSYRTMLRYLQELSGMGVPLYSEVGRYGGYSILHPNRKSAWAAPSAPLIRRLFKPSFHVVGVEFRAPFTAVYLANAVIPKLWTEVRTRVTEIHSAVDDLRWIGVVQNRSMAYHYVAGIEVASLLEIPEGMVGMTLPAQAYAVYTHQGITHREERDQTYFHALERLRQQNMDHDPDAYGLEIFRRDEGLGARQEYEIYMALK